LKGELSGNFEECMIALFKETTFYDAYSLRKAIKVSLCAISVDFVEQMQMMSRVISMPF
jgi:hypothetical protein